MSTYRPNANTLRNQALMFATVAHGSQVRAGNDHIPYIFHPVDVANEVIYYSGLPVSVLEIASVIAILHDTVEDTAVTIEHIMLQFLTGEPTKERVSAAVSSMYRCSNTWPEHMFANKRAYQSHLGYINRLRSNFDSFLMNNGDLLLLTAEERKEMGEKGVAFREHSEANDDQ